MDARQLKIGDKLTLRIQGIPLEATVASVRERVAESVRPFFSFVFPSAVLANAPQTIFTGIRVTPDEIPALQNRMVAQFPNITVIDVTATIASFARVVERVTRVVRFFAAFSILAGLLIVISSVYATRLARIQEAAYYKVLGAKEQVGDRCLCTGKHRDRAAERGTGIADRPCGCLGDHDLSVRA